MPVPLQTALEALRADLTADTLVRAVAAGRRKGQEPPPWRKQELRFVDLAEGPHLQVVSYDDTQAFTRNVPADAAAEVIAEALAQPYGNWHVDTLSDTVQVRVTKRGEALVHRRARELDIDIAEARRHDRAKPRLLDPADPLLRAVGISDAAGRVKPSRTAKLRQIEDMLRTLEPVVTELPDGPLRVVDLGCGNAYLTFAAYRFLTQRRDGGVDLVGVDVKAQARERNSAVAESLGWAGHARFIEGRIGDVELDQRPDLVLALHACDTASDDALAQVVRWQAPVALVAPCCHHDLQAQLRGSPAPSPYSLLTRHGILRERLADGLTDALRARDPAHARLPRRRGGVRGVQAHPPQRGAAGSAYELAGDTRERRGLSGADPHLGCHPGTAAAAGRGARAGVQPRARPALSTIPRTDDGPITRSARCGQTADGDGTRRAANVHSSRLGEAGSRELGGERQAGGPAPGTPTTFVGGPGAPLCRSGTVTVGAVPAARSSLPQRAAPAR